jgi:hypothetical protein
MTFSANSSLVRANDYQNASIYLDLSSNSAFTGYKVYSLGVKAYVRLFVFVLWIGIARAVLI